MEGLPDALPAFRATSRGFAARFEDPEGRRDRAGRVIVHEVVGNGTEHAIDSFDVFIDRLWPVMDAHFANVWTEPTAPVVLDSAVEAP